MRHESILGNAVAAEMTHILVGKPSSFFKNRQVSNADVARNALYSLSKIANDLNKLGLTKTSNDLVRARNLIISEAADILEDLGLESKEEDNIEEALERRPDLEQELKEELLQDPDIEIGDEDPRLEGLSYLDEVGMDLEEQLALLEGDESELYEKLRNRAPNMRKDQLEKLMKEWDQSQDSAVLSEINNAIAKVDSFLSKYSNEKCSEEELDKDFNLVLDDLEINDFDSNMVDSYLDENEDWEDE